MELMLDIETLGLGVTSVVTQIGWCLFDFEKEHFEHGCFFLDPENQMKLGRTIDWGTFKFWMQQEEAARMKMIEVDVPFNGNVLSEFIDLVKIEAPTRVWANGTNFDISIIDNLLETYAYKTPWKYNSPRDCRTIWDLCPWDKSIVNKVKHDAEQDALFQAKQVWQAWRKIKEMPPIVKNDADEIPF